MSDIKLGSTVVNAQNYEDYIKAINDEANAHQDVSQADLAPLEQFLGMSGMTAGTSAQVQSAASALGITTDQLTTIQNQVAGLANVVEVSANSAGFGGLSQQTGTSTTNQMWNSDIDALLSGVSAVSAGIADSAAGTSAGGISAAGTVNSGTGAATSGSVTYPSNTPLADAASRSGATINYNQDNNLFTVSSSSGIELYSGAGQDLGSVPTTGLKVNITNPANPSLGYVNIDGSGKMTNSSGSSGQFADMTISGTGQGGYAAGNTGAVGTSSGGTVSLPPGSDASVFAQQQNIPLNDPSRIRYDPASGAYALKGGDGSWHVFDGTGHSVGTASGASGSVSVPAVSSSWSGNNAYNSTDFTLTNGTPSFSSVSGSSPSTAGSTPSKPASLSSYTNATYDPKSGDWIATSSGVWSAFDSNGNQLGGVGNPVGASTGSGSGSSASGSANVAGNENLAGAIKLADGDFWGTDSNGNPVAVSTPTADYLDLSHGKTGSAFNAGYGPAGNGADGVRQQVQALITDPMTGVSHGQDHDGNTWFFSPSGDPIGYVQKGQSGTFYMAGQGANSDPYVNIASDGTISYTDTPPTNQPFVTWQYNGGSISAPTDTAFKPGHTPSGASTLT